MELMCATKFLSDHVKAGKPTYFVDNVCYGLVEWGLLSRKDYSNFRELYAAREQIYIDNWQIPEYNIGKIHTMRAADRFKEGTLIHFKFWLGTAYKTPKFMFTPFKFRCTGTQKVEIVYERGLVTDGVDIYVDNHFLGTIILKDGLVIDSPVRIDRLARNDGFYTTQDFVDWFKEDWTGYIIHWTKYRYAEN